MSGRSSPAHPTSSVVHLCQQFLASHGFNSAAEALSELTNSSPPPPRKQPIGLSAGPEPPSLYIQFRNFCEWIDRGLEMLRVRRVGS